MEHFSRIVVDPVRQMVALSHGTRFRPKDNLNGFGGAATVASLRGERNFSLERQGHPLNDTMAGNPLLKKRRLGAKLLGSSGFGGPRVRFAGRPVCVSVAHILERLR
jgi:hypothetical protein